MKKQMKETKWVSAAVLTIKDAANMTPKGRSQIADWLKAQAVTILEHGDELDKTFRARYLYQEK